MADLYDGLADLLVYGAQERFVAELTGRLASQLAADVDNPDLYALTSSVSRRMAMGVWARWSDRVTEEARKAFEEALAQADEEAVATLAAAHAPAASGYLTSRAANRVAEAARGMAEIVRRQNVALCETAADAYYDAVADAVTRKQLGEGRQAVMERAYAALADAGLETVDYRSGAHTTIDAAIRRHVVTQQSQCRAHLLEERMDEWGHDLVYTSAHYGARPSHQPWQGRVFSRSGRDKSYPSLAAGTGYGTAGGLCGCNCKHTFYPYVDGLSKLPSTDFSAQERLTGLTSEEYYKAAQGQRGLERRVRKVKREVCVGQANGEDMAGKRAELGVLQRRLRDHCEANKLRRDYSRERAYGVAEQPRALGTGQRGQSLTAFAASDAFKTAAKAAGVTQKAALEALKGSVGGLGRPFESLTPARQLAALKRALRGLTGKRREIKGVGTFKFKGVPEGEHFDRLAELAAVNPNFATGLDEWRKNCQRCTVAYEARRRGFDVRATPRKKDGEPDEVAAHWREYFDGTEYERCPAGSGYNAVVGKMRKWGPGARAIVYVAWKKGNAHVFSAENVGGKVVFSDPQTGERDCSRYFKRALKGYTEVMRVDAADFSKWSKGCFEDVP